MGSLLSKMKKCNRGNQPDALCKKKKTFSKGGTFFSKSKKMPRSQIACEELKREAQHPIVSFKCKRNGKEIWPKKRKVVSSYEEALRREENEFMLQYLELLDRKRDRVSNWLDTMDTDEQSYSGLYLESDCSCNTSMYSIESSCDPMVNLGPKLNQRIASAIDSHPECNASMHSIESRCNSKPNHASNDSDPRLDSSLDSDSDYMSDTLDYEADISSNDLDVDNLQSNGTIFNHMAEIEDCFKPGGEYFGLYCDLFTKEVTRLYKEFYGGESESGINSQIQNLCAEKSVKLNLQENEVVLHNKNAVEQL